MAFEVVTRSGAGRGGGVGIGQRQRQRQRQTQERKGDSKINLLARRREKGEYW
jgi:hypothetical protein